MRERDESTCTYVVQSQWKRFASWEELEKEFEYWENKDPEPEEKGSTYTPSPTLNQMRTKQRKARKHAKARARRMARR